MNRITPEMVLKAYEETGLKPKQGKFFQDDGCACGLGAVAKFLDSAANSNNAWDINMRYDFSNTYQDGFYHGFDGLLSHKFIDMSAYRDGKAAWEAVKHLGEVR